MYDLRNELSTDLTSLEGKQLGDNIYHYIGRLGHLLEIARTFVRVCVLPSMAGIFETLNRSSGRIRTLTSPPRIECPLVKTKCTGKNIIGRLCNKPADIEKYYALYQELCSRFRHVNYEKEMSDHANFSTRVHAELQLVDYFSNPDVGFWGPAGRYVGCSKAACYLCDLYVKNLKGVLRIDLRGTHGKMYLPWRPPDLRRGASTAMERERKTLIIALNASIRDDAKSHLEQLRARVGGYIQDSTTGFGGAGPGSTVTGIGSIGGMIFHSAMLSTTADSCMTTSPRSLFRHCQHAYPIAHHFSTAASI